MANEQHEPNRSSALTPELIGAINMATSASIKETMAALMPMFERIAITPEKLREANKPYVDPAKTARNKREMKLWRQDIEDQRGALQANQDACMHADENQKSSINLIHNFPDRQPRGICTLCQALIHPKEWRTGAPDDENPRGKPYLVEPHKDYRTVLMIQARRQ